MMHKETDQKVIIELTFWSALHVSLCFLYILLFDFSYASTPFGGFIEISKYIHHTMAGSKPLSQGHLGIPVPPIRLHGLSHPYVKPATKNILTFCKMNYPKHTSEYRVGFGQFKPV